MPLRCEIVTQDRRLFEGPADMVVAPGSEGLMGILPHHAPLLSTLDYGLLTVRYQGEEEVFTIAGGDAGYADMRYTFGTGVRLGTPVGPVRFDYGWKLRGAKATEPDVSSRQGTFHFSLGQAF